MPKKTCEEKLDEKTFATLELVVWFDQPVNQADMNVIIDEARGIGEVKQAKLTIHKDQTFDLT